MRGELSATEAARRVGVAEQTVHNWRFAELVGVPRRTYHARLARLRAGEAPKGP